MDSFSAIPVFVAVVESGSFSKAAAKLGVSKSAVSKRISQLEDGLGVRLLHRSTRRLSLTEAGQRYFEHAARALAAGLEGEDAATQLQGEPQGVLRVNAPMSFGRLHLAPLVADFLARYPGIQMNMVMDDRVVDMVEGGFDVAIRAGTLPDSALVARPLAACRSVICAAPAYLAREGRPHSPDELRQHNCLFYSYYSGGNEWALQGAQGLEKVVVSGNYQVNNSEALREAVLAGLGIARIPTFIIGKDLVAGRLVSLLEDYPLAIQTIYAVFAERRHLPAKVRVFLDFMIDRFGAEKPYWDVMP